MTSASEIFGPGFAGLSERGRLEKAAQELEAVVVTQLLQTMRNTVPEGGLFEKSAADDIFRSLLDGELARETASKSPFGLADAILERFENRIKDDDPATEALGNPPGRRSWRV